MTREGTALLAAAIIKVALEDRKKYTASLKLNPENVKAHTELEDLDDFFEGDMFEVYCAVCDMNPEVIRTYLKENNYDQQRILAKSLQDLQKAQIKENQITGTTGTSSRNKSKSIKITTLHRSSVKDGRAGCKNSRPSGKHTLRRGKLSRSKKGNKRSNIQTSE